MAKRKPSRGCAASLIAGLAVFSVAGNLRGQDENADQTRRLLEELRTLDPALARELALPKVRVWDASVTLTTGLGFKDNVLYNYRAPVSSGFARNGADFTLFRLPINGWQFYAYAYGEDLRYFSADPVKKEQMAMVLAQAKKEWPNHWQMAFTGQYLFLDQIMDLDSEFGIHLRLPVLAHSYSPKVSLRHDFGRTNWWEVETVFNRQDFLSPLDDYWDGGVRFTLGRYYGRKSEVSLGYEFNHREFETRQITDTDGIPLPGPGLTYAQHRLALNWRHYFDARRRWRASTRLAFEQNNDNGSGYFDYWKYLLSEQLRYQHPNWELAGQVRLTRYDYPVQKASTLTLDLYDRVAVSASLRGEVKVAKGVKWFAEYQFEQNLSSQFFSEYRVNTVCTGINWEF